MDSAQPNVESHAVKWMSTNITHFCRRRLYGFRSLSGSDVYTTYSSLNEAGGLCARGVFPPKTAPTPFV